MYVADEPHPHKNERYDSRDGASVCSAEGCKYEEKRKGECVERYTGRTSPIFFLSRIIDRKKMTKTSQRSYIK